MTHSTQTLDDTLVDSPARPRQANRLRTWIWVFIAVGVAWRLLRYALRLPVWGDEAILLLNFVERHSYRELMRPLSQQQIAPIGFVWTEFAIWRRWGDSEFALRLLPLMASTLALLLFVKLARATVRPLAALLAVALLATTHYTVRFSTEIKPYSFDLLMSVALLLPAALWLRRPRRWGWLAVMIAVAPLAISFSYPSIFIAGAVAAGMLPVVARQPRWSIRLLYATFVLVTLVTFTIEMRLVSQGQYDRNHDFMLSFWDDGFPPRAPGQLLVWLAQVHSSELMAYPEGGKKGGSTITLVLVIAGIFTLARRRRVPLLIMLLGGFALTLVAAALRRYPYGSSVRIQQHLGPPICLLAGSGAAAAIDWLRRTRWHRRALPILFSAMLLVTAGSAARDVLHPYHVRDDLVVRNVFERIGREARGNNRILLICGDLTRPTPPTIAWDLQRLIEQSPGMSLYDGHDLLNGTTLWVLCVNEGQARDAEVLQRVAQAIGPERVGSLADHREPWPTDTRDFRLDVYRWRTEQ